MKTSDASRPRRMHWLPAILVFGLAWIFMMGSIKGCASPVVKTGALDATVLSELTADGRLVVNGINAEHTVANPLRWMKLGERDELVFASLREENRDPRFVLVVDCDPRNDRLLLFALADGETPLDVLADDDRRARLAMIRSQWSAQPEGMPGLIELSLQEVVNQKRLGPPLPTPRRILAVAANFPTHLVHDLDVQPAVIAELRKTPARVFQKHPPMEAPGSDPRPEPPFKGLIGPFDSIVYPDVVSLPDDEEGVTHIVPTFLDYEVELGFVLNRRLTLEDVQEMTDDALWDCVAGYVLVSDVKARNPQVFGRILSRSVVPTEKEQRYLTGDPVVDGVIGGWDEETCAWWGYAASQGNYAALGPYFVAANGERRLPERAIVAARSYAAEADRGVELPKGLEAGPLYLRQTTRVSTSEDSADGLLWGPPAVMRAVLSPRGALDLGPEGYLERGDVIALGTPGGVALTVNRSRWYRVLDRVLFWWDAIDWHDAFFNKDEEKYLHEGDGVFLWGEGLGFQQLVVHQLELPEMPAVIEEEEIPAAREKAEEEAEDMDLDSDVEKAQDVGEVETSVLETKSP